MADPTIKVALLKAIKAGDAEVAANLAFALAHQALYCRSCGGTCFAIEQLTWNRQYFNAAEEPDCWGDVDYGTEYEDHPLRGACADCDADVTPMLIQAGVTTFHREPDWDRLAYEEPTDYADADAHPQTMNHETFCDDCRVRAQAEVRHV